LDTAGTRYPPTHPGEASVASGYGVVVDLDIWMRRRRSRPVYRLATQVIDFSQAWIVVVCAKGVIARKANETNLVSGAGLRRSRERKRSFHAPAVAFHHYRNFAFIGPKFVQRIASHLKDYDHDQGALNLLVNKRIGRQTDASFK
jgi:hypothetical protein